MLPPLYALRENSKKGMFIIGYLFESNQSWKPDIGVWEINTHGKKYDEAANCRNPYRLPVKISINNGWFNLDRSQEDAGYQNDYRGPLIQMKAF